MRRLPAEFEEQSFVQVVFPHKKSDWSDYLEEAEKNFVDIINAIAKYQQCLVVCDEISRVKAHFTSYENIRFVEVPTNDTWARDSSAITVYEDSEPLLLVFVFTAWGGKFDASLDNTMSKKLADVYDAPIKSVDFILEGGAIESNGKGTLLITSECVFNPNRNAALSREQSLDILKEAFGVSNILSLEHGYLSGDDTDSHIDTLARFVDAETIVYLRCEDKEDEHFEALEKMETELKAFRDQDGKAFTLVPLPFTRAIYDEDERLPATYANFLIMNKAVLVPVYNDASDQKALDTLQKVFPSREIVAVDCSTLIRQHGSLHCVTMQFPSKARLKQ